MSKQSMILITGYVPVKDTDDEIETFKMIPIDSSCPYNEAIFNPINQILYVVSKEKKDSLQSTNRSKVLEYWYEYQVSEANEITYFMRLFATNFNEFPYQPYMSA